MKTYLDYLQDVYTNGQFRQDRTGVGTYSVAGRMMRFDLTNNKVPVLTTKRIHLPSVIHELLWMLSGDTNVKYLQDNGVTIWDEWADDNGDLGPVYGGQWRNWQGIDQIQELINGLKTNPFSRRHIVNSWNVSDLNKMALPPCHLLFQFHVSYIDTQELIEYLAGKDIEANEDNAQELAKAHSIPYLELTCQLYQRSADSFLGVPFNIAFYSILTHMVAQQVGMRAKEFIWVGGDCHIYSNHTEQVKQQLSRTPLQECQILLAPAKDIFSYCISNIVVYNNYDGSYKHLGAIKAPVAV